MKSVVRRPDLRSQRPKSILSPPRKSSNCSSLSSSKNLFSSSILALSFNSHRPPTGGTAQKASPRIPVSSVGGVHLSEPLLAPYLFGPVLLSQAVSQDGDKLPFHHFP
ncbi:hypothetical protein AVEN_158099-1 [Araneus ventricosus]|uniref:Uncharacterized protein n=1 Tax=Araneus ventricosus TaxID=182803 RepID=A0A4Y2HTG0_ARAVE|nr:hypothetical protein AVEN_158099-1 [Araneus ventricosus]